MTALLMWYLPYQFQIFNLIFLEINALPFKPHYGEDSLHYLSSHIMEMLMYTHEN